MPWKIVEENGMKYRVYEPKVYVTHTTTYAHINGKKVKVREEFFDKSGKKTKEIQYDTKGNVKKVITYSSPNSSSTGSSSRRHHSHHSSVVVTKQNVVTVKPEIVKLPPEKVEELKKEVAKQDVINTIQSMDLPNKEEYINKIKNAKDVNEINKVIEEVNKDCLEHAKRQVLNFINNSKIQNKGMLVMELMRAKSIDEVNNIINKINTHLLNKTKMEMIKTVSSVKGLEKYISAIKKAKSPEELKALEDKIKEDYLRINKQNILNFISKMPLSAEERANYINKVKEAQNIDTLNKIIKELNAKAQLHRAVNLAHAKYYYGHLILNSPLPDDDKRKLLRKLEKANKISDINKMRDEILALYKKRFDLLGSITKMIQTLPKATWLALTHKPGEPISKEFYHASAESFKALEDTIKSAETWVRGAIQQEEHFIKHAGEPESEIEAYKSIKEFPLTSAPVIGEGAYLIDAISRGAGRVVYEATKPIFGEDIATKLGLAVDLLAPVEKVMELPEKVAGLTGKLASKVSALKELKVGKTETLPFGGYSLAKELAKTPLAKTLKESVELHPISEIHSKLIKEMNPTKRIKLLNELKTKQIKNALKTVESIKLHPDELKEISKDPKKMLELHYKLGQLKGYLDAIDLIDATTVKETVKHIYDKLHVGAGQIKSLTGGKINVLPSEMKKALEHIQKQMELNVPKEIHLPTHIADVGDIHPIKLPERSVKMGVIKDKGGIKAGIIKFPTEAGYIGLEIKPNGQITPFKETYINYKGVPFVRISYLTPKGEIKRAIKFKKNPLFKEEEIKTIGEQFAWKGFNLLTGENYTGEVLVRRMTREAWDDYIKVEIGPFEFWYKRDKAKELLNKLTQVQSIPDKQKRILAIRDILKEAKPIKEEKEVENIIKQEEKAMEQAKKSSGLTPVEIHTGEGPAMLVQNKKVQEVEKELLYYLDVAGREYIPKSEKETKAIKDIMKYVKDEDKLRELARAYILGNRIRDRIDNIVRDLIKHAPINRLEDLMKMAIKIKIKSLGESKIKELEKLKLEELQKLKELELQKLKEFQPLKLEEIPTFKPPEFPKMPDIPEIKPLKIPKIKVPKTSDRRKEEIKKKIKEMLKYIEGVGQTYRLI
jgi:hypothetical protein